MKDKQNKSRK